MAALALALTATASRAGEFFERDGVALAGYDPVAYFTAGAAVAGSRDHTYVYRGSTFRFASPHSRDAFAAEPERYAPQYGGFCAYGLAKGYKAKIDPSAFTVVDGKLYLNYDRGVEKKWRRDIPGYVAKGDANWPEVSRQTKVVQ